MLQSVASQIEVKPKWDEPEVGGTRSGMNRKWDEPEEDEPEEDEPKVGRTGSVPFLAYVIMYVLCEI